MKDYFLKLLVTTATLSSLVIASVNPARADDYSTVCVPINASTTKSTTGDQAKSYCAQARTSKITHDYQNAKTVIMAVATAYLTTAAFIPTLAPTCSAVSLSATGAGLGIDVTQGIKTGDVVTALTGGLTSLGATLVPFMSAAGKSAESATKAATTKAAKMSCITGAVSTLVQGAMAAGTASAAKKTEASAIESAKDLKDPSTIKLNGSGTGTQLSAADKSATGGGATGSADVAATCDNVAGNNYLSCLSKNNADAQALTYSPDAVSALENTLGGKSLGDFAKGYTGDSPAALANYVASGMGLGAGGSDAIAKTLSAGAQIVAEKGLVPSGYASSGGSKAASGTGEDSDFNKMMAGLLKQLNPDGTSVKEDPSLLVFRQLDLLPPSKIETNKEISLFARIGYRYRKKADDVDQLHWANPSNETESRTPASQK